MKKLLHLLVFCLFVAVSDGIGQVNLVPNPSFEDFNTCPDQGFSEISMANGWTNPTGYSPDYFNSCAPVTQLNSHNVPNNWMGFQYARSGDAYAGIITMQETNTREYIQTQLIESLKPGKVYLIKFFVCLSGKSLYSSNDIGVHLSENAISSTSIQVLSGYIPKINNDSFLNPLNDTLNWIEISDTIIADGGEKFLTIGNFFNDVTTDTILMNGFQNRSYHFIDDVSVLCLDCDLNVNEMNNLDVQIFPNPASEKVTLKFFNSNIVKVSLLNNLGYPLLVLDNVTSEEIINTSMFSSGIYYLSIENKSTKILKPIFIFN